MNAALREGSDALAKLKLTRKMREPAMLFKRLTITALLFAGMAIVAGVFAGSQQGGSNEGIMRHPLIAWQSQTPSKAPETLP